MHGVEPSTLWTKIQTTKDEILQGEENYSYSKSIMLSN